MICYAIIDTNVIVSALLKRVSIPSVIVELVGSNEIVPIISDEILKEYINVLARDKFAFKKEDISYIINKINNCGLNFKYKESNIEFSDPDDKKFYDLYKSCELLKDVYLITGNKKHFPNESNIVSPTEFIEIIGSK